MKWTFEMLGGRCTNGMQRWIWNVDGEFSTWRDVEIRKEDYETALAALQKGVECGVTTGLNQGE
jgi:hypothetical protein